MNALLARDVETPARRHLRVVGEDYEPPKQKKGSEAEAREHLKIISRRYNALTPAERMAFQARLPDHEVYYWMTPDEVEFHYWIAKAFYTSVEADRSQFHKRHLTARSALVAVLADRMGYADAVYLLGNPDLKRICAHYGL